MSARDSYRHLLARVAEVSDLGSASAVLSWDQETHMPPKGAAARALQLSTLAGLRHRRFTDPQVGDWLAGCEARPAEFDEIEQVELAELRRDFDRSTRVPGELVRELTEARSAGLQAWRSAREENDFGSFAPHLEKLVLLTRRKAEALGYQEALYDALLEEFERGATTRAVRELFDGLRTALAPLVAEVLERQDQIDSRCVLKDFGVSRQAEFARQVIETMGFDLDAGRVDDSTHPFCTSVGRGDTRLTRRFLAGDLRGALYAMIHEAGHGLYEQGLPAEWDRRPLGEAVSLGIHESQSRLWENMIGRSRPFWDHFLPSLRKVFPGEFDQVDSEEMYRAVNQVQASLIRVEADELTYNLHVILRFDLELALFGGDLQVADLPGAWNDAMQDLLGVRPRLDADGCLQDIHWAMGGFGYFPTYTLGNLYAAQLDAAARRDLPDLDERIRGGDLTTLREWLRDRIHRHGRRYLPARLIENATGQPPGPGPFLRYLQDKFGSLYGVPA